MFEALKKKIKEKREEKWKRIEERWKRIQEEERQEQQKYIQNELTQRIIQEFCEEFRLILENSYYDHSPSIPEISFAMMITVYEKSIVVREHSIINKNIFYHDLRTERYPDFPSYEEAQEYANALASAIPHYLEECLKHSSAKDSSDMRINYTLTESPPDPRLAGICCGDKYFIEIKVTYTAKNSEYQPLKEW